MSNERLRGALVSEGLTRHALSEKVGVDPKTVDRWISGRLPHRVTRLKVATLLGEDETFLWPETRDDPRTISSSEAEVVGVYANRGSVDTDLWMELAKRASAQLDIGAFAANFLPEALPQFVDAVEAKAREGVRVRLMFGDPESSAVRQRGEEENLGHLLAARCELTWNYWRPLIGVPGVEARKHGCTLYNSLFRFDDTVLVNSHAFATPTRMSPVMHLRKVVDGHLFAHYMESFERMWDGAAAA